MSLSAYTKALIDSMNQTGLACVDFEDSPGAISHQRARSRLTNAARHAGFVVETRIHRDSMAGFGPVTGVVEATVVGWTDAIPSSVLAI